jgi:hypothetical protein
MERCLHSGAEEIDLEFEVKLQEDLRSSRWLWVPTFVKLARDAAASLQLEVINDWPFMPLTVRRLVPPGSMQMEC